MSLVGFAFVQNLLPHKRKMFPVRSGTYNVICDMISCHSIYVREVAEGRGGTVGRWEVRFFGPIIEKMLLFIYKGEH